MRPKSKATPVGRYAVAGHAFRLTLLGAAAFFAPLAAADGPSPPAGSVSIASLAHAGSACPEGSVAANISPDAQALTILFDRWIVDASETPLTVARKQCRIDLRLAAPVGWRYAILGLDYRGYAELEAGARAEQNASYRFNGGLTGQLKPVSFTGPVSTDYLSSAAVELSALPWSSCGGDMTLTLDTSTSVDVSMPPVEQGIYLASGQMKYAATDVGAAIQAMTLVKKDSALPCKLNKTFGFQGTKAWVDKGCRGSFTVRLPAPAPAVRPHGMITVDSIDGQLTQNYGLAWQQCQPGRWVNGDGQAHCAAVCKGAGLKSGRDPGGAMCASGEARPASAIGQVNFKLGCWGDCTSTGAVPTEEVPGGFCYMPGQKRDADRTDKTVGCFCY